MPEHAARLTTLLNVPCNGKTVCPGVHDLDTHPDVHFVIGARAATPDELAAWTARGGSAPAGGEQLVAVPPAMDRSGYMVVRPCASPDPALAALVGPGEVLGTVPAEAWTLEGVGSR